MLYRWPVEGWVCSTVTCRSSTTGFSHVVRYGRTSALGAGVVPLLLDSALHCLACRWVLLRREVP
jgi:predicted metal-binding membrane protein